MIVCQGDICVWKPGHEGAGEIKSAVVNAANERMLGGGGVDGAIHKAAGVELRRACERVSCVTPGVRCPTGSARITDAFMLPVDKVRAGWGWVVRNMGQAGVAQHGAVPCC